MDTKLLANIKRSKKKILLAEIVEEGNEMQSFLFKKKDFLFVLEICGK